MIFLNALAIVSGIASIISLFLGIREAKRAKAAAADAKDAATVAVEAKEQVFSKQSTLDLDELLKAAKQIESLLIKLTSPVIGSNHGHNPQKEHREIEGFLSILNEKKGSHTDVNYVRVLREQYDFICVAINQSPKPYKEILRKVQIIISETKSMIRKTVYD